MVLKYQIIFSIKDAVSVSLPIFVVAYVRKTHEARPNDPYIIQ